VQIIEQTQNWIKNVVIGCNFCPFAAKAVQLNSVHFHVLAAHESPNKQRQAALEQLAHEMHRLDTDDAIETTFIICPDGFADFEDYLDLVDLGERLLTSLKYDGVYQLASFHPEYCFADSDADDPANYTNRSPYPMLHLLREASVERALAHYPDAEGIPDRNIQFAREKGLAFMRELGRGG
jgi:uncharacterized protein